MKAISSFFLVFFMGTLLCFGQKIDETFNPKILGVPYIKSIGRQSDNKTIIVGNFLLADGVPIKQLARFNSDGSLDDTFNPPTFEDFQIIEIAISDEDKIILFDGYGKLHGLNKDGSINTEFSFPLEGNILRVTAVKSDFFIEMRISSGLLVYKVDGNGSIDESFTTIEIDNPNVLGGIDVLNDGRIVISGYFQEVNGYKSSNVAILNVDGTVDETFNSGSGINDASLIHMVVQDEKIILTGKFTQYNDTTVLKGVIRLNLNGSIDKSFKMGSASSLYYGGPSAVKIASDGKIFLCGVNPVKTNHYNIYRLNQDGSIDSSFVTTKLYGTLHGLVFLDQDEDNNVVVCGNFSSVDSTVFCGYAKFDANGNLIKASDLKLRYDGIVTHAIRQPDNKILLMGSFVEVNGEPHKNIARLNADGSIDNTFKNDFLLSDKDRLQSIALQNDGKILIGGLFMNLWRNQVYLIRLNSDGSIDQSYTPYLSVNGYISVMKVLNDGKILIAGAFKTFSQFNITGIGRLNQDGSIDKSFNVQNCLSNEKIDVKSLLVDPNNKNILLGAYCGSYPEEQGKLILLDSTGNLVPNYQSMPRAKFVIYDIKYLNDTTIAYGGERYPSKEAYLYTTNPMGTVNDSLLISTNSDLPYSNIRTIYPIDSTNFILGGTFKIANDIRSRGFVKTNLDGEIDDSFHFETNPYGTITKFLNDGPDHIIAIGRFTSVNDEPYYSAVRIKYTNSKPEVPDNIELTIKEDSVLTISIDDIGITDEDDVSGVKIEIKDGDHYTVVDDEIIPEEEYSGTLAINASVSDGKDTVDFVINIEVTDVNDPPVIVNAVTQFEIIDANSLSFSLADFTIEDPDNTIDDMSLMVNNGDNYSVSAQSINLTTQLRGEIQVSVQVSDGDKTSEPYTFPVYVMNITALSDMDGIEINMYPNPTYGQLILTGIEGQTSSTTFEVIDMNGRSFSLKPSHIDAKSVQFNLGNLNKGLYTLKISNENTSSYKKILLK